MILTGGRLKQTEFHVALLVKCGVNPSDIAILIGRSKATVAYRRENLGFKVFGEKKDFSVIDGIIHLL